MANETKPTAPQAPAKKAEGPVVVNGRTTVEMTFNVTQKAYWGGKMYLPGDTITLAAGELVSSAFELPAAPAAPAVVSISGGRPSDKSVA